jgi:excisionase family DNA binding protein
VKSGENWAMASGTQKDELLTIKEFSKIVKIASKTLYRLASQGKIPCIRIGRNIRFSPDMIDQMRQEGKS